MKQIKTLVLMQLRDKIDLSWTKTRKGRIHTIIMSILKFAFITVLYSAVLYAAGLLNLVYYSDMPKIMTLVITLVMVLLLITNTMGLTKSLYFAEDNKVLITLPVSNNKIFVSKLLVFFFYELKRSFSFTIPIILGCILNIHLKTPLPLITFLWIAIPMLLIIALPVLIGALLSIPALYGYRLMNKVKILKVILFLVVFVIYIYMFIYVAGIIPPKIDMINQWPEVRRFIIKFLNNVENKNVIVTWITRTLIGEQSLNGLFSLNFVTIGKTGLMLGICVILYIVGYLVSRPLFFIMMSKSFEFNKDKGKEKKNKRHLPFISFNLKEFKVSIRSIEVSLNYLLVYMTVPLLILILNQIFIAIDKSMFGVYMSYAFNILIIVLPLLLSNSLIATLYSKEGRAGYIKKTKPINPIKPLLAKLTFNIVCVIPSVVFSVLFFSGYVNVCAAQDPENLMALGLGNTIALIAAILLLYYAHLFCSATLDIMNPLNEAYATTGTIDNNENENKASIIAFVMAVIFSGFSFILFNEAITSSHGVTTVCFKLLFIAVLFASYFISNYFLKIKAFYAQGRD